MRIILGASPATEVNVNTKDTAVIRSGVVHTITVDERSDGTLSISITRDGEFAMSLGVVLPRNGDLPALALEYMQTAPTLRINGKNTNPYGL